MQNKFKTMFSNTIRYLECVLVLEIDQRFDDQRFESVLIIKHLT